MIFGEEKFGMWSDHAAHHTRDKERDCTQGLDNACDGAEHVKLFISNIDHARGHNKWEKIKFCKIITPVMSV